MVSAGRPGKGTLGLGIYASDRFELFLDPDPSSLNLSHFLTSTNHQSSDHQSIDAFSYHSCILLLRKKHLPITWSTPDSLPRLRFVALFQIHSRVFSLGVLFLSFSLTYVRLSAPLSPI